MSKKIIIPSINLRNDLGKLFKSFISRVGYYHNVHSTCYGYGCVTYDDYDYPYEDYETYQEWKNEFNKRSNGKRHEVPPKRGEYDFSQFWDAEEERKKSKNKHGKRHGKKGRVIDINTPYCGEEDDYMDGEYDYDERSIYFYPDYHDRENKLEFTSYDKFKEFCESMNYKIPDMVDNWIRYNTICHCCLSREALLDGAYEIMAEESYGVLFYEVCEADEL